MQQESSAVDSPVVLIASGDEWLARSIESILAPSGIRVLKALTGQQALELARSEQPDAVLLESRLPDMDSFEACRSLRENARLAAYTPIVMATVAPSRRKDRLEALRAGAWDYCDILPDTEELVLRLETYVRAKTATDQIRKASLRDDLTGLYNLQGLMRRLQEVGSDAMRHHRPLAVLAIAPDRAVPFASDGDAQAAWTERLGQLVTRSCRASDSVARLPSNEFVVLATETAPPGAQRLAERVLDAAATQTTTEDPAGAIKLRIGFFAVWDFTAAAIEPVDMLVRATTALQASRAGNGASRIVAFDSREASLS